MRKEETTVSFFLCLNSNQYYSSEIPNKSMNSTISCNAIFKILQQTKTHKI